MERKELADLIESHVGFIVENYESTELAYAFAELAFKFASAGVIDYTDCVEQNPEDEEAKSILAYYQDEYEGFLMDMVEMARDG